jgi:hypothetical protein
MRWVLLATIATCLCSPAAAEGAADAIAAFGLIGSWSVDCGKTPMQTCDKSGCGGRTTYVVPPSGPPLIRNTIGTLNPAQGITYHTTINSALSEGGRLKIISTQETPSGTRLVWWRQPGERWEIILLKEGNRYRTYSARSEDGKKISAEAGFQVMPPPDTKWDAMPTNWVRSDKPTPWFERCGD